MINILYQDTNYIAVEKPSGILVHPYKKECKDRVSLMSEVRDQIGQYVYPFQRLDRPVSGVVFFGLNSESVADIQKFWNTNLVSKHYLTLCRKRIDEAGVFDFQLSDENKVKKDAITQYNPLWTNSQVTLLDVKILTGRKHQIRRHFSRRCFNLIGDTKYGKGPINHHFRDNHGLNRIFLHCYKVNLKHPYTGEEITIRSNLSEDLIGCLDSLSVEPIIYERL